MKEKKKIVLFCEAPVSFLTGTSITAHNYRSQQIIDLLHRHGIPALVIVVNRDTGIHLSERRVDDLLEYWEVNDRKVAWRTKVRRRLAQESLHAAIALMLNSALVAHSLVKMLPLWVDFYGDPLIEKIGQDVYSANEYGTLAMRWRLQRVLTYADRFSVCSEAQKSLLVGALLYQGMIDFKNMKTPTVNVFYYLGNLGSPNRPAKDRSARSKKKGMTILYNGSINSWTDVSFLSDVLEEVLMKRRDARFVQFGKNIINTEHLEKFRRFAQKRELKNRVQFLGEISETDAEEIYRSSHICVSADIDTLETRFGWRTRYIKAMAKGLVIVSTLGNDLSSMLANAGVGLFSPMNDRSAFVKNILTLIDNRALWQRLSGKGVQFVAGHSRDDSQFAPLLHWLDKPEKLQRSTSVLATLRNRGTYLRWPIAGRLSK